MDLAPPAETASKTASVSSCSNPHSRCCCTTSPSASRPNFAFGTRPLELSTLRLCDLLVLRLPYPHPTSSPVAAAAAMRLAPGCRGRPAPAWTAACHDGQRDAGRRLCEVRHRGSNWSISKRAKSQLRYVAPPCTGCMSAGQQDTSPAPLINGHACVRTTQLYIRTSCAFCPLEYRVCAHSCCAHRSAPPVAGLPLGGPAASRPAVQPSQRATAQGSRRVRHVNRWAMQR